MALSDDLTHLEALYPATYPLWHERTYGPPSALYTTHPLNNCSVEGHATAPRFAAFLVAYLIGRVLDIGCGPQTRPLYLDGYPDNALAGLDPLPPHAGHTFHFRQGVAECLPWPAASFATVITATSLDHVLDLDRALAEIARVLAPGGVYVAWEGIHPDAPPYTPGEPHPYQDACHLFKLGPWFVDAVEAHGLTLEKQEGAFYAFRRVDAQTVKKVGWKAVVAWGCSGMAANIFPGMDGFND